MKLIDILLEKAQFITTQTGEDEETGKITWKVTPTPGISLNNNLDKMYSDFQKFSEEHPNDPTLERYLKTFKNLKQALRSHMTKKYSKKKL